MFSGTTEGRELALVLAQRGHSVTVCVATEYGAQVQPMDYGIQVKSGRMSAPEMACELIGFDLCIDATHPYAVEATSNIAVAARDAGVRYERLLRTPERLPQDAVVVDDVAGAASWLGHTSGNVLITTGAKELALFSQLGAERLYARVLPFASSLESCEDAGIACSHIVAMQGPFSVELNVALMNVFSIDYLVTKEGGALGGFPEKAEACRLTGATLVVVRGPLEQGLGIQELVQICEGGCR